MKSVAFGEIWVATDLFLLKFFTAWFAGIKTITTPKFGSSLGSRSKPTSFRSSDGYYLSPLKKASSQIHHGLEQNLNCLNQIRLWLSSPFTTMSNFRMWTILFSISKVNEKKNVGPTVGPILVSLKLKGSEDLNEPYLPIKFGVHLNIVA